jgi:membrane-associated phospholipid phosphatase
MFQTEPILFLQQFAGDGLTWAMRAITALGYPPFFFVALTVVLFGMDVRRGFVLAQLVMWTDVLTEFAKAFFALPRPSDVDLGVRLLETGRTNTTPWTGRGASSFLALPDREAVAWLRSQVRPSFGLPSGHVSVSTALWGGLSAVFRNRAVLVFGMVAVPLIALSRMVLGRHFLGDVLAGGALGALVVLLGGRLLVGESAPLPLLCLGRLPRLSSRQGVVLLTALIALPIAVLVLGSASDAGRAGRLLGLNLAYLLVACRGLPDGGGTLTRRVARVAVGLLLGVAAAVAAEALAAPVLSEGPARWVEFGKGFVPTFVLLWGGVLVCRRLGLYGPAPTPRPMPSQPT